MAHVASGGGAWRGIVLLGTIFLAAFVVMRSQSRFLQVEREAVVLHALARNNDLDPASVFALREQAIDLSVEAFAAQASAFASLLRELGEPLAAVALFGSADFARQSRAAKPEALAAWQMVFRAPAAVAGQRFLLMRERFAARAAARNKN
jgi:hypothetical protein